MIQVISGTLGLTDFSPILLVNSPEMYLLYWLKPVLHFNRVEVFAKQ